jgi:hypothetical protein
MAPRFLRATGFPRLGLHGVLPGPRQVARPLVAERQGYAGVRVAGHELEAAVQQLSPFIELANPGVLHLQRAGSGQRQEDRGEDAGSAGYSGGILMRWPWRREADRAQAGGGQPIDLFLT